VGSIQEEGEGERVVEAKVGVMIDHPCFKRPRPVLMGVRRGEFNPNEDPVFRLKLRENWSVDGLVH